MKFDLIIKDATAEEVKNVLNSFQIVGESQTPVFNLGQSLPNNPAPLTSGLAVQATESSNEETTSNESVDGIFDKDGLPWDGRIHSGNKKMTAKGVWTRRRGVQDSEVAAVEAELRSKQMPAAVAEQFVPPAQPAAEPAMQPFVSVPNGAAMTGFPPAQPFNQYQPPAAEVQPAPVYNPPMEAVQPQPVIPQTQGVTFEGFLQHFQSLFNQGRVSQDYLTYVAQKCGCASITDLGARPDLIQYAVSVMQSEGKW